MSKPKNTAPKPTATKQTGLKFEDVAPRLSGCSLPGKSLQMQEDFSIDDEHGNTHTGKAGDYLVLHPGGLMAVYTAEYYENYFGR
jgi:hypothetical protein